MRSRRLAFVGASLVLGCNVGPKYERPVVASPAGYLEAGVATGPDTPPGTWQPARPQDAALKGKWWEMFNEPELNALEERLDIGNQNIAQFFQNFMAARAQVGEARAGAWPTVTLAPAYRRTAAGGSATAAGAAVGTSGNTIVTPSKGSTVFNSFSVPLAASWEPDLWGRVANTVREMQSAAQVSAADLENERLSEQASLAEFYFELRGQDSLQDVYDRTIAADRTSLELTRALAATGIDSDEAIAQAEVTLENAEAAGLGVATNRALFQHAIATLIGTPAPAFAMPVRLLSTPVPPIPVGVPSPILQRRPDVAAAGGRWPRQTRSSAWKRRPTTRRSTSRRASGSRRPSSVRCSRFRRSSGRWGLRRRRRSSTRVYAMRRWPSSPPPTNRPSLRADGSSAELTASRWRTPSPRSASSPSSSSVRKPPWRLRGGS